MHAETKVIYLTQPLQNSHNHQQSYVGLGTEWGEDSQDCSYKYPTTKEKLPSKPVGKETY